MTNYKDSKIYKIVCRKTGLVYIGSTTNKYLCNRLGQHNHRFKNKHLNQYTSSKVLEGGDYYIELIELVTYDNKDELTKRERYWIENTECVNKQIAGQTKQEYRELIKDTQKEYMKNYYLENKQKFLDKSVERRAKLKEASLNNV